jgi:hypothetical protein
VPLDYPETSAPELDVQIRKGLTEEHRTELLEMAQAEAANNEGSKYARVSPFLLLLRPSHLIPFLFDHQKVPAIFAICEVLREWLSNHNTKGLDDASMHAQMMRRAKEEELKKVRSLVMEKRARAPLRNTSNLLHGCVYTVVVPARERKRRLMIRSWASLFPTSPPRR